MILIMPMISLTVICDTWSFIGPLSCLSLFLFPCNVSVNPKPDHPPGDSHILVAPGVGFSLLCLARGSARGLAPGGVLNQSKSSIILKKARFLLCLLNKWVPALFICLYMLEVSSVT